MYTSCANCVNIVGVDALLHSANINTFFITCDRNTFTVAHTRYTITRAAKMVSEIYVLCGIMLNFTKGFLNMHTVRRDGMMNGRAHTHTTATTNERCQKYII